MKTRIWLGIGLAVLLAACGGGSDDSPPTAVGAWTGTTTTQRDVTALVLGDGSYYLLYSAVANPSVVGGAVQGTGTLVDHEFRSSDALGFSAEGAGLQPGTLAATVTFGRSFDGTFTPTTGTAMSFQTTPDWGFLYPPSLQALAGSYTGQAGFALGVRPAVFTVTSTGAVTSNINGCPITGTAAPRADGNVYDLTIVFGGAPCAFPGASFSGIAYLRPDTGRLYAVARNAPSQQSVIFSGSR